MKHKHKKIEDWKKLADLPEGYYCGEAVSLNNEIYFVAGRNDKSVTPYFYNLIQHIYQASHYLNSPI